MSLWYAQSGPRSRDLGKFHTRSPLGTTNSGAGKHRGWNYEIIAHQTGTSVRRTSYNVAISDQHRARMEYLRGFGSAQKAIVAAEEWIEAAQARLLRSMPAGEIGTIPALPASDRANA